MKALDRTKVERSDGSEPRVLPAEVRPPTADALCVEASLWSLTDAITPTRRFLIRSHFPVPTLDPRSWRLAVRGSVGTEVAIDLDAFRALPHRELDVTVECAGNSRADLRPKTEGVQWGHGAVSTGRWRGVPLRDVLDRAGVAPSATEVVLRGADRGDEPGVPAAIPYEMSIPVSKAIDPDTLLVDEMNGAPLTPSHGFPVRAIVPGYYGMASVKWLTEIELVDRPFEGHFRTRAYAFIREGQRGDEPPTPAGEIRVKSLITQPREQEIVGTGPLAVRGVAWSGAAPIARVEVSVSPESNSGGLWLPAQLHPGSSRYAWTRWQLAVELPDPGFYVLRARATDEAGNTQPMAAEWNYRGIGNNSIHGVPVEVRSMASPPRSIP